MVESAFKPVFLVPYYNHPSHIAALVAALATLAPVLIVDDGSDEASKAALRGLDALVFTREINGGKGAAIKDGFLRASELGFTHAFQVDADFQHDIGEVGAFLDAARENPEAVICGEPIYDENAPKSRLYGRKITNFWCAINSLSLSIKDGMCGFRVYPLAVFSNLKLNLKEDRMGFDAEILVLAVRAGVPLKWLGVRVNYEVGGVSHFRLFRDNVLISLMHARLCLSLPFWLARRALKGLRRG